MRKELEQHLLDTFNHFGSSVDISEPEEAAAVVDAILSKMRELVPAKTHAWDYTKTIGLSPSNAMERAHGFNECHRLMLGEKD